MKLKRDASGNVVVVGENPVIVDDEGKESELDVAKTIAAIKERNQTIVTMRDELKAVKEERAKYGDLDPAKAREALEAVSKLDMKKLVDAGQVDQAIAKLKEEHTASLSKVQAELASVQDRFKAAQLASAFGSSEFLKQKVANTPVALLQSYFEKNFGLNEDGVVVGLDGSGKPIYSIQNPSQLASFDEAVERFIGSSPFRDSIITSTQQSGSGAPSGSRSSGSAGRMTRKQFDLLPPHEQAKRALDTQIVD